MPQHSLVTQPDTELTAPVTCLGLAFPSDAARRTYFTAKLREKLRDPAFRAIEGFPSGSDEEILALSDPPFYTACPNPFIEEVLHTWQAARLDLPAAAPSPPASFHPMPFAADMREGKNDPLYNAHPYHTKVPHKAIMRYILHYTKPGDVVLDSFCGTGTTGVAAQFCANPDPEFQAQIEQEWEAAGWELPEWGGRHAILADLSPAATFIAYNYNSPFDAPVFEREAKQLFADFDDQLGWMYTTAHTDGQLGRINYTVWSEVLVCPTCGAEIIYYATAAEKETLECQQCHAALTKKALERAQATDYDQPLQAQHTLVKYTPVLINYQVGMSRFEKQPDAEDLVIIQRIQELAIKDWFPIREMPAGERKDKDGYLDKGISHLHHFYFRRALIAYAWLWQQVSTASPFLRFFVEGSCLGFTKLNPYSANHFSQVNRSTPGTLFVGALISEISPAYAMSNRIRRLSKMDLPFTAGEALITNQSTTRLTQIPAATCDYVFVNPPFGNSLQYAELNFFWEAWLKLLTNRTPEAVMDKGRHRTLMQYQQLMVQSFREIFRVLKPGKWITVEFHNSSNSVWNALQEALQFAGFVVADVRTPDKQQETYKQSAQKLVKQDLVISAYKPTNELETRFRSTAGSIEGVWDFVRSHLAQLPVFVKTNDGQGEVIAERQNDLLFDRMVAFHVQRDAIVPLSIGEFYADLAQRFPERDGMFFLPEHLAEYDTKRMTVEGVQQVTIIVSDEASAIQWIRQQVTNKPQTLAELTPEFLRELKAWNRHEKQPELRRLLEENFLCYQGDGPLPAQIVAWLRRGDKHRDQISNEIASGQIREEHGVLIPHLTSIILAPARDRWYAPDLNRAIELEKQRLKGLLKEFTLYREGKGKRKFFRIEAVRAGFVQAYRDRDFATIVQVAERLPEYVVQEDPELLMYYDSASVRGR